MGRRRAVYSGVLALFGALAVPAAWGQAGREANIQVRATPPSSDARHLGPYPAGTPAPEQVVPGGVRIAGQIIRREHYDLLRNNGFVPMRREMTDEEFRAALKPEFQARLRTPTELAAYARKKFREIVPEFYWGFRAKHPGRIIDGAETAYREYFASNGTWKDRYTAWMSLPKVEMLRWAASYWNTRDPKWSRAVRDTFMTFYHANRPPLNKITGTMTVFNMWRTLECGADTLCLPEIYAQVCDSPEWSDRDHLDFFKAMLERGRFLRYTTVPVGPWPSYNAFGYGNWILYQLEGLLAVAANFPELRESDDWLRHATDGIGRHADWCVLPDGGFDEYSYSYAAQEAGELEFCYNTFRKHHLPMPPRFRDNVRRLHELFLRLATPGGHLVPFGDTHRGDSMTPSRSRWAAVAFLDGRFKYFADDTTPEYLENAVRVLHPEDPRAALRQYRQLPPLPPNAVSDLLPEPGWALLRSGWDPNAVVLGLSYRASDRIFHAGWEMLGFNLYARGEPLMTKLLGFQSYTRGYPPGIARSPRQANLVVVQGAAMARVAGSLRNWYSSRTLDFLDVDHRGWLNGRITARRRILFLKPEWIVMIDDLTGPGSADACWQAHCDQVAPEVEGPTAIVTGNKARAAVTFLDARPTVEKLTIAGTDKTVYLLAARKTGRLPLRYVTLFRVGARDVRPMPCRALRDSDTEGMAFGEHLVRWEQSGASGDTFVAWFQSRRPRFFAGDGNDSPALTTLLDKAGLLRAWNGRVLSLTDTNPPAAFVPIKLEASEVNAFTYHGRIEMTPVGTAARVAWRTSEPALHSVLYRPAGASHWLRQIQPDPDTHAWILLPDLAEGGRYELVAVSELKEGRVARTPILYRQAPPKWNPF